MEQNLYSLINAKFLKIKTKKFAHLDCDAILQDFQKHFSTKCVLITTKRGRDF
jgi:hypothetical protein